MSVSDPFISRPIGTTLISLGLLIFGMIAYVQLPVASMPAVDLPTIRVSASRPGADPAIMAATVAAPLERRLGEIAGVTEMTSSSSLGSTSITVQFALGRNIDKAARDVQGAINAATSDLPSDLPSQPSFRKFNPNAAPILILALTSDTLPGSTLYDVADSVLAQRISQIDGVADVTVAGAEQPAIRIRMDPGRLAAMGLSMDTVRSVIAASNTLSPVGSINGETMHQMIAVNDQLKTAEDYRSIIIRQNDGAIVRLGDIADVQPSTRNSRAAGWFNNKNSVSLMITKRGDANVITTVDRVKALLPELEKWIPKGVEITIVNDRSTTVRATVNELLRTLAISVVLVMAVVFVFLRQAGATMAAGLAVPLSLAGTFPLMWLAGFSIDIVSLLAIIVAVGFVVDDAIVMIENVERHRAMGLNPLEATRLGARQIGFTVVSISLSLIAAFIPLMFMPGIIGKVFQEFSWTMAFAITLSAIVSLTAVPALLGQLRNRHHTVRPNWTDRALARLTNAYMASLKPALRFPGLTAFTLVLAVAGTVFLIGKVQKGYLPQDDTGLLLGFTEAAPDISFTAMRALQLRVNAVILADPAVEGATFSIGSSGLMGGGAVNSGRMFIALKPADQRDPVRVVMGRMRAKLNQISGISTFMFPAQDIRAGGRQTRSQYQFTVWGSDIRELQNWTPRFKDAVAAIPGIVDVTSDQERGGLQTITTIDRDAAARLGVKISDIDAAMANAFSQRQITTIYGPRNQYRVILEVDPAFSKTPTDIARLYVPGPSGTQVPLASLVSLRTTLLPLTVNHQGPFPSITISYGLAPDMTLEEASRKIREAVNALQMPQSLRADFAGDAKDFADSSGGTTLLIVVALLVIYIVLGVLYESLIHPLTILSTLPSAGLGALITLYLTGTELSVMAVIGIILLIGIVKKNGIMLVDFAIEAVRDHGKNAEEAIISACRERFRPILMTTLTALLGAIPLAYGTGPGAALRAPLGLTIIGGLIASQILTLYTTPALYLVLERLSQRFRRQEPLPQAAPAE